MKTEQTFEEHLRKGNLSENTITSYLWTVNYFHEHYDKISKDNLLAYKGYLMEFFKPKTVNLRIQGINKYLEYCIFRKNRALAPHERSAVPLGTDHCPVG